MSSNIPSFLNSQQLSSKTKSILLDRMQKENVKSNNLSLVAYKILEKICDDILPQKSFLNSEKTIKIARLIDHNLVGLRDGWRFAELPSDLEAWEFGLKTLSIYADFIYKKPYCDLKNDQRGSLLDQVYEGTLPYLKEALLNTLQMKLWIRDLRSEVISTFLSHPIAQEFLNITSNLTGGDEIISF